MHTHLIITNITLITSNQDLYERYSFQKKKTLL